MNLGVFLCLRCGSIHRGLGTHISIPKGCTGTYFWGPDEIDRMKSIGNENARRLYGGDEFRPTQDANESVWTQFIVDKYKHRKYSLGDQFDSFFSKLSTKNGQKCQSSMINPERSNKDRTKNQLDTLLFENQNKDKDRGKS